MEQTKNDLEKLDVVLLKDGRSATIMEAFNGTDFIVDVGSSPKDWDTISITIAEIERVVWKNRGTGERND